MEPTWELAILIQSIKIWAMDTTEIIGSALPERSEVDYREPKGFGVQRAPKGLINWNYLRTYQSYQTYQTYQSIFSCIQISSNQIEITIENTMVCLVCGISLKVNSSQWVLSTYNFTMIS